MPPILITSSSSTGEAPLPSCWPARFCRCSCLYILRSEHEGRKTILPLGLIVAAAWLTNVPSAVMLTYSLVLLVVIVAILRRSPRILLIGAGALLLGLALAAFYIVPVVYEQKWVEIAQVLSPGVRPQDNFLFTLTQRSGSQPLQPADLLGGDG